MQRIANQPAYVLHSRAYRETSLLLDIFSRDFGRTALVARGARRPKSRSRNVLQPFRPLLLSWSSRGELGTLTGSEQVAAPPMLQGEPLYCGLYISELMIRFLHRGDPHPELFERYRSTLAGLSVSDTVQPLLRVFEKQLLETVGYGLMLEQESGSGRPVRAEALYQYRPGLGPVRISSGDEKHPELLSGEALLALQAEKIERHHQSALRRLMRDVIAFHLGEKPLRSQGLFRDLNSQKSTRSG